MVKTIDFNLEYREKGEKKNKLLSIDFITQGIMKRYDKLMSEINEVTEASDKRQNLLIEIINLRNEAPDGWKELQKQKKAEVKELENLIKSYNDNGFFERRFDIIKMILEKNGITEDKFLTFEFWEDCVDLNVMLDFMNTAIWKDLTNNKKKV